MKRFTFGMPEKMVPSRFCDGFRYVETDVNYPAANFTFKKIPSGCVLEFPIEDDCHIFGFGLQLKQFDHRGRKLRLDVNADPVGADGESHAPVPFFVTNKGYGMYFDTARYAEFYCGKQKNTGKKCGKVQRRLCGQRGGALCRPSGHGIGDERAHPGCRRRRRLCHRG